MRETSTAAATTTLSKCTTVGDDQLQVKRKFKSINGTNRLVRWWFVLRGSEDALMTLEREWEQVQLQTNWKLEPYSSLLLKIQVLEPITLSNQIQVLFRGTMNSQAGYVLGDSSNQTSQSVPPQFHLF